MSKGGQRNVQKSWQDDRSCLLHLERLHYSKSRPLTFLSQKATCHGYVTSRLSWDFEVPLPHLKMVAMNF